MGTKRQIYRKKYDMPNCAVGTLYVYCCVHDTDELSHGCLLSIDGPTTDLSNALLRR